MKKYLFGFLLIGAGIYTLQKLQIPLPMIINNYVNDFLIIPITLIISLVSIQKIRNNKTYRISPVLIVYVCALYSFIFEYYLPKNVPRYTYDIIDIVVYFLGGLLFYFLQKISQ